MFLGLNWKTELFTVLVETWHYTQRQQGGEREQTEKEIAGKKWKRGEIKIQRYNEIRMTGYGDKRSEELPPERKKKSPLLNSICYSQTSGSARISGTILLA